MHYFASYTNLLNFHRYVKSNSKQVSYELKNLAYWLKANKISLNVAKTKHLLFTSPKKQLGSDLKIKLNGKRFCETDSVKYLGIQIDKSLTWKRQINHVTLRLNNANAKLSKLRHVLDKETLRLVYWALFKSHLCYASLVWVQNTNQLKEFISYIESPSEKSFFWKEIPTPAFH